MTAAPPAANDPSAALAALESLKAQGLIWDEEYAAKRSEVLGLIKQGLLDFSISRTSITWGIPIPWDPAHVTYVWFDALVNYCTAVGELESAVPMGLPPNARRRPRRPGPCHR